RRTKIESIVDFGHAPIFEDADTFPCVIVLHKPAEAEQVAPDNELSVTAFPRSELEKSDIAEYVASHQYAVPQKRLGEEPWSLEPEAAEALYRKIKDRGVSLTEFAGVKPFYGIKTGCNEAFIVDDSVRRQLVKDDPNSVPIFRPFL